MPVSLPYHPCHAVFRCTKNQFPTRGAKRLQKEGRKIKLNIQTSNKVTIMTGTEHFKQAIKAYLDERAKTDELFAVSYAKENKKLDDCITFILTQAKAIAKEGGCGMTDEEVYSLATHYYDEDNIEVGKLENCGVIVNHRVELSEQEKAEARERAIKAYQEEELRKIQQRNSRPKPTPKAVKQEISQPSLFDFE